jgi:colanic acid/amylovoran biosynthesis glycosyltransferase
MATPSLPTVGHIKDNFLPGSEAFIFSLIRSLKGYHSIVLDRHAQQNPNLFPFAHHHSPVTKLGQLAGTLERMSLRLLGHSPYLERILRSERVKLLHAHFGQLGALFVPVARRHRLPLVTSFYGTDVSVFAPHPAWRERFDRLWEYGSRVLVVGPAMAARLATLGCPEEKITVLPLSLDLQIFNFIEHRPSPEGGPTCILSAGRLIPVKGMDVLLRAVAALRYHGPLSVWIAGDGPERAALEHLSRMLKLEKVVSFLGWMKHAEMAALMAQAHLFVLASRTDPASGQMEGSPTVLLEAQATGLPVVSTFHGDVPFIVQHGKSGILVPEGDPDALADALDLLLRQPEQWGRLGEAGRVFVERSHDRKQGAAQLEQVYYACMRGR